MVSLRGGGLSCCRVARGTLGDQVGWRFGRRRAADGAYQGAQAADPVEVPQHVELDDGADRLDLTPIAPTLAP
jgi:hypothetical protein